MKILLLHEMSGVHTNLKFGLEKIGHEVDIATYGDGWKQYPSGINIGRTGSDISAKFSRFWGNFSLIKLFSYYDVVQIISPDPFFPPISPFFVCRPASSLGVPNSLAWGWYESGGGIWR